MRFKTFTIVVVVALFAWLAIPVLLNVARHLRQVRLATSKDEIHIAPEIDIPEDAPRQVVEEVHGTGTRRITYAQVDGEWIRESSRDDARLLRDRIDEWFPQPGWFLYAGILLLTVAWLALMIQAFAVHLIWGLVCLFVPFGSLLFIITHLRTAYPWLVVYLMGWTLTVMATKAG